MTSAENAARGRRIPAGWTSVYPRSQRAERLAGELRDQILAGRFGEGERLEEAVLAARHTASRNTVREALELLRREGLIERRRGAGTTVRAPKYGHGLDRLTGLAEALAGYGTVRNRVVSAERLPAAPDRILDRLELEPGSGVVRLERLRFVNDEPLSYDISYLPADIGVPLLDADLVTNDVFGLIEQTSGQSLGRAELTVHATNAEPDVAAQLGLITGAAIFTIERLTRLADDRPVDSEVLQIRADRFALEAVVHRDRRADLPGRAN
ncbi:GntR family transcriptional regulator [Kribbella karoonensis]|uniref:GntR family transcriptional regulator n=1 Tax=Kribbella karoonensis TaxID=324851 RepID=A0ABN2DQH8_9ACTN